MTTLEKIKAEIMALGRWRYDYEIPIGSRIREVLAIIDKYAEQSGWEEMTVQCKHCGKDMTFKIATIGEPCEYCKYKSMAEQEPSVQPKTECDHPDKCHECEKIFTCDYYKRGAK